MTAEAMDAVYQKANAQAQAGCPYCEPLRHHICTYHEGWADGFEVALELMKIAVQQP